MLNRTISSANVDSPSILRPDKDIAAVLAWIFPSRTCVAYDCFASFIMDICV